MKYFLYLMLIATFVKADNLSSFLKSYKNGEVQKSCSYGRKLFRSSIRDEKILLAISDVCAKADYIDFIAVLQQRLGKSAQSREAAVYISTLSLQRRLISQHLNENTDISLYSLPKTDHILSTVFEAIKNKKYTTVDENPKHIKIEKKDKQIDVHVSDKIYINVYQDNKIIQKHRYRL